MSDLNLQSPNGDVNLLAPNGLVQITSQDGINVNNKIFMKTLNLPNNGDTVSISNVPDNGSVLVCVNCKGNGSNGSNYKAMSTGMKNSGSNGSFQQIQVDLGTLLEKVQLTWTNTTLSFELQNLNILQSFSDNFTEMAVTCIFT